MTNDKRQKIGHFSLNATEFSSLGSRMSSVFSAFRPVCKSSTSSRRVPVDGDLASFGKLVSGLLVAEVARLWTSRRKSKLWRVRLRQLFPARCLAVRPAPIDRLLLNRQRLRVFSASLCVSADSALPFASDGCLTQSSPRRRGAQSPGNEPFPRNRRR